MKSCGGLEKSLFKWDSSRFEFIALLFLNDIKRDVTKGCILRGDSGQFYVDKKDNIQGSRGGTREVFIYLVIYFTYITVKNILVFIAYCGRTGPYLLKGRQIHTT